MLNVNRMLEGEEENKPGYQQKKIAQLNKNGRKDCKSVEFYDDGSKIKVEHLTSGICDVEGD